MFLLSTTYIISTFISHFIEREQPSLRQLYFSGQILLQGIPSIPTREFFQNGKNMIFFTNTKVSTHYISTIFITRKNVTSHIYSFFCESYKMFRYDLSVNRYFILICLTQNFRTIDIDYQSP